MNHPKNQTTTGLVQAVARDELITGTLKVSGAIPQGMEKKMESAVLAVCEFYRPPRPRSYDPLTGMSRSGLIAAAEAAGACVRVRLRGRARGSVLIDRVKLLNYLRGLTAGKEGQ